MIRYAGDASSLLDAPSREKLLDRVNTAVVEGDKRIAQLLAEDVVGRWRFTLFVQSSDGLEDHPVCIGQVEVLSSCHRLGDAWIPLFRIGQEPSLVVRSYVTLPYVVHLDTRDAASEV